MVFRVGDGQMNRGFRHLGTGRSVGRPGLRAFGLRDILAGSLLVAMAGQITPAASQIASPPEPDVTAAAVGEPKPAEEPAKPADAPKAEAPKPTDAPVSSFQGDRARPGRAGSSKNRPAGGNRRRRRARRKQLQPFRDRGRRG